MTQVKSITQKKVVLISFLYDTELGGGAAVAVNQLAHALFEKSYQVSVITSWECGFVKTDVLDGIKVIRIPPMNLYWVGAKDRQSNSKKILWQLIDIWNPFIYRITRQLILNEEPEIVHSHKLRGLSPSIWSAAVSAGAKKIIHTCHDFELLSPEGLFMGKIGILAQEQNLIMRPYQYLRRRFSRHVNDATAPSRFVLDYHKKMGFFPRASNKVIHNSHGFNESGLDEVFSEASLLPKHNRAKYFLFLGRLDKTKGIECLCEAFSQFTSKFDEMRLRIAGSGPQEGYLREKYNRLTNIEFFGPVYGEQKEKLFKDSDVLISPSQAPESFGIVIIEAFAHGLPVIASDIGAYPEIIREGETGLLVKPGSEKSLFSAMEKINKEKDLFWAMSQNCFKESRKYTITKLIKDYLDLYRDFQ